MHFDRKQLKRSMRDAIHEGKTNVVWIALLFLLLTALLQILSMSVSGELSALEQMAEELIENATATLPVVESSTGASLLVLAIDIMLIMLSVGFTVACLSTARRKGASVGNLFDGFSCFLRALSVEILQYLILSAYSMVYALPVSALMLTGSALAALAPLVCAPLLFFAVRAFYNYRQAVYLMLDHPELSAFGCMRVSRELMCGHKWEMFRLDLSFLGWVLLCMIPFAVIWVLPYMQVCYAGYYDRLVWLYRRRTETAKPPMEYEEPENAPDEQEDAPEE